MKKMRKMRTTMGMMQRMKKVKGTHTIQTVNHIGGHWAMATVLQSTHQHKSIIIILSEIDINNDTKLPKSLEFGLLLYALQCTKIRRKRKRPSSRGLLPKAH